MTEEPPEVRELTLSELGPDAKQARLTLADDTLLIETDEDSPLPEWMRGEIPFDDLDIVYVDPAKEQAEEGEEEEPGEEDSLPPGVRIVRWIEVINEETDETFPRRASITVDEGHIDVEQAEAFALTFAKLAGRPIPGEEEPAAEEAPAEEVAERAPTGAPEAAEPEPVAAAAEEEEETPAFVPSGAFAPPDDDEEEEEEDEPEDKAFV